MSDYFEWLYMTSFYVTIVNKTSLQANWNRQTGRQTGKQAGGRIDLGIGRHAPQKMNKYVCLKSLLGKIQCFKAMILCFNQPLYASKTFVF